MLELMRVNALGLMFYRLNHPLNDYFKLLTLVIQTRKSQTVQEIITYHNEDCYSF